MKQRMRIRILLSAAVVLAQSLAPAARAANYRLGRRYGGDFTLTDHQGRRFALRDARGKVVLIHFGFTSCASTCPVTMAKVSAVLEQLGPHAAQVLPVLITVDTRRDTPEVLRHYVAAFHPAYVALTGTQGEVEAVARQYRAPVNVHKPDRAGSYAVDHGSGLYLVDADGMLADIVLFDLPTEGITRRIVDLLPHRPAGAGLR